MIVLSATTDTIKTVLSGAVTTNPLRYVASWRDITTTTYVAGRTTSASNDTTPVTSVAAPAASTQRVIDLLNIFNADTVPAVVTVSFDDNGTSYPMWSGTLTAGQSATYCDGAGWAVSA